MVGERDSHRFWDLNLTFAEHNHRKSLVGQAIAVRNHPGPNVRRERAVFHSHQDEKAAQEKAVSHTRVVVISGQVMALCRNQGPMAGRAISSHKLVQKGSCHTVQILVHIGLVCHRPQVDIHCYSREVAHDDSSYRRPSCRLQPLQPCHLAYPSRCQIPLFLAHKVLLSRILVVENLLCPFRGNRSYFHRNTDLSFVALTGLCAFLQDWGQKHLRAVMDCRTHPEVHYIRLVRLAYLLAHLSAVLPY